MEGELTIAGLASFHCDVCRSFRGRFLIPEVRHLVTYPEPTAEEEEVDHDEHEAEEEHVAVSHDETDLATIVCVIVCGWTRTNNGEYVEELKTTVLHTFDIRRDEVIRG